MIINILKKPDTKDDKHNATADKDYYKKLYESHLEEKDRKSDTNNDLIYDK